MSDQDFAIYQTLLNAPDKLYVTKDQKRIYHLQGNEMVVISGDFKGKSPAELNQIVCVATNHC